MTLLKGRVTVCLFVLALVAAACGGGSGTASGGGRRGFAPAATNRAQPRLSPKGIRGPTIQPPPAPAVHQSGAGTNEDPYVAYCDPNPDGDGNCVVSTFDTHYLNGATGEDIAAYKCPPGTPFLVNKDYAPFGTTLYHGVENREDVSPWSIGVVQIDFGLLSPPDFHGTKWYVGADTLTNGGTHAYNWAFTGATYQIVLHCTGDHTRAYCLPRTGDC